MQHEASFRLHRSAQEYRRGLTDIQYATFKAGVHLGEGYELGISPHALDPVGDGGAEGADLQPLKVFRVS